MDRIFRSRQTALFALRLGLRRTGLTLFKGLAAATLALAALVLPAQAQSDPVRAVASIAPLHSLLSSLMTGAGTPELLVPAERSPHGYALKPSEAEILAQAQLIVWIGPGLDAFAGRAAQSLAPNAVAIEAVELPGLALYPPAAGHGHGAEPNEESATPVWDPHIWLDPANAKIVASALADILAQLDPAHAALYAANRARLDGRLDALDRELRTRLAPFGGTRFVTFHSAYQYLERRYGLNGGEALTLDPEQRPGARRVGEIRKAVETEGVRCVFAEPQFPAALAETLVEGTSARIAMVDPLGAGLAPGPDEYFELLDRLGRAFADCLAP